MRLPPREGERIDRSQPLHFRFGDEQVSAFAGDTLGSALFAHGLRTFSRSFKYHRPRGLLCCGGNCPNCLMTVDGVPNVRVCVEPAREGAVVAPQNVWGSLERDLLSLVDRVGDRLLPVGFYYRTLFRPRWAWPAYERVLRRLAGLGRVGGESRRSDVEHLRARVLVIGGGRSGRRAAELAAGEGPGVVLVHDDQAPELSGVQVLAPARALAVYEGGLVPVDAGDVLYRVRAERIVVATGTVEQPLVFPGNDLVGVMLPGAARRLVRDWSVRPGRRAVVVAAAESGLDVIADLEEAGVEVAETVDLRARSPQALEAHGKRGRLRGVRVDGAAIDCDLLVAAGTPQPAYSLLAQAGARVEYESSRGVFVPVDLPPRIEAVGSVTGAGDAPAPLRASYTGTRRPNRSFVCVCEDVTEKDVRRAVAEAFDSIELVKRYSTVTMGPCQGRLCQLASVRLCARETDVAEAAIGRTTARPPWTPVELGLLAGRPYERTRHTSLHARHEADGAELMWAGSWRRPHSYGDVEAEVRAVHEALGVIDVSTLGKILVAGPGAAELLDRLYPNRFSDLKIGRIRYGVLTTDGGRIMDDGTVARLDSDLFYVTTTSSGSEAVVEWFEWWNASWGYEADIVDVTGALAAVNLAGPQARATLQRLTDADVSNDALGYLGARELRVAGVPCLALRLGFVGELGYELHLPASAAEHLWAALVDEGARPFGVEAQRVLRLEKAHIIVGQDTDSESNLLSSGMSWLVNLEKDDFVGRWAVEHVRERGVRERLVGFTMSNGALPAEGAQVVVGGLPAGRVTSARVSERAGAVIGLAWVRPDTAEDGRQLEIRIDGGLRSAHVTLSPFYDAEGARLRS